MTRAAFPSPFGAARVRFLAARGEAPYEAALLADVAAKLPAYDDSDARVFLAWELVSWVSGLTREEARALFLLVTACLVHESRGSTYLPIDDGPESALRACLAELGATADDQTNVRRLLRGDGHGGAIDSRVAVILGGPADRRPLVVDGAAIYLQRLLTCEDRLVRALGRHLAPTTGDATAAEEALARVLARPARGPTGAPVVLSPEQRNAVIAAATRGFTAITGGPGTGKTSIVVSLLRVLVRLGVEVETIALAAPTGKAAHRMETSVQQSLASIAEREPEDEALLARCPPPRTLHRLLGYSPSADRFFHHENNRLAEQLVIVDEASMIDLYLADALARAVGDSSRFVLLGDADQLPSVEAGAVFRDVVESGLDVGVRLTHSYRMAESDPAGSAILRTARAVNAGNADALFAGAKGDRLVTVRTRVGDAELRGVELVDGGDGARDGDGAPSQTRDATREAFLEKWFTTRVFSNQGFERRIRKVFRISDTEIPPDDAADLAALFAHYQHARILTVTRGPSLPTGADAVNAALHRRLLAALRATANGETRAAPAFYPGEPVMVTHNDYGRDLYNGDQGLVLRVVHGDDAAQKYMAVFARGETFVAYSLDALRRSLTLAFALTVHKSQGSEHDDVAILLPDAPMPLLTREILYTAITRAKKSVTLVGSRAVLASGVGKRVERQSGVAAKLAGLGK